ncbi:GL23369 [Drosophila persimilis]|uniref:GL23369 n=1 Tax=Drosophila persimilis TaxID=7234 RepID=B4G4E2_DROPE|nr:voltage-dependent anion-selective channel [Drosophila persimilis]EDW24490.1 GL23369 [Drosophila persimilis]
MGAITMWSLTFLVICGMAFGNAANIPVVPTLSVTNSTVDSSNTTFPTDISINLIGPLINASAVLGPSGLLAKITTNNFALGYSTADFVLHTAVNDGQDFRGSIFVRPSDQLDLGVLLSWAIGSNNTKFALGANYF